jgi:hypothetical protein
MVVQYQVYPAQRPDSGKVLLDVPHFHDGCGFCHGFHPFP